MRQTVDVLAIFDADANAPRPIRFKIFENGIKVTVKITEIIRTDWVRAGGVTHIKYDCITINEGKRLEYSLMYFYSECRWEYEAD